MRIDGVRTIWPPIGIRSAVCGLVAALLLGGGLVLAKGGGKPKPPPDPVDTGVIYLEVAEVGGGQLLYQMNPDGSGLTALSNVPAVEAPAWGGRPRVPSHALHGLERWFLMFREVTDDAYPSTNPRFELFAVSESGTSVQLTDGETNDASGARVEIVEPNSLNGLDHEARADQRWATDGNVADGKVSYLGGTWAWDSVAEEWYVREWGVYVLTIDPDDLESHTPARPARLPIELQLKDAQPGLFVNTEHSWAPDGKSVAYRKQGIRRADYADGSWTTAELTSDGYWPEWSPDPDVSRILFIGGNSIEVMNSDGTGRTTVLSGGTNKKLYLQLQRTGWSPNASHIQYELLTEWNMDKWEIDVCIAEADGSGATNLTTGILTPYCRPVAWRSD